MPANIAHMVVVHKAFELLRTKGSPELAAFAGMIDDPTRRQDYAELTRKKTDKTRYKTLVELA